MTTLAAASTMAKQWYVVASKLSHTTYALHTLEGAEVYIKVQDGVCTGSTNKVLVPAGDTD